MGHIVFGYCKYEKRPDVTLFKKKQIKKLEYAKALCH